MHGEREGDGVKRRRAAVADVQDADSFRGPEDFFTKDGRKIQVGDCALFQSGNAPPFIGIIRWFGTGKENYFKLCVNWLYRPADVKLAKGISLEAAPNEVFYSFHRDEIPAASLLHPCKVAFLRKGFELPSGLSSFVCRRVYDIENKCLWWLTDQDYINERQEEVDQLLDRSRLEMHALQSGGRSPKPQNGPASTQSLKSGSEGIQNSGTSLSSQIKGKKRERSEQGIESVKQEHNTKVDEGDPVSFRFDTMIKSEVAKLTEKGGLVSFEAVEKLVQLMQLDRAERKIDLSGRVLIADAIAATDRIECLGRFVQLRGVPVLDDWLQEVQKGKIGDSGSPKDGDKSIEELLSSLLRALDKLPVNLNALQTCNIGKSVNHLRNHKNLDIQKKARSLIDTWKKRVDAEMTKINDAKAVASCQPVTWPAKQGFVEVSHGSSRRSGSSESAIKSSIIQQYACKGQPAKPGHVDGTVKSPLVTTAPSKSSSSLGAPMTISPKDSISKSVCSSAVTDFASMTGKEEKNTTISQSQTNNFSVSGDPTKMISSWKEDVKNSTSLSTSTTKTTSGSSRNRRSNNVLASTSASGIMKDTSIAKSSPNRTSITEKILQSNLAYEKAIDTSATDHGNSQRLIVRLPNPGRSPARSASGCSFDESSIVGSKSSSPGDPDKHDYNDRRIKFRGVVSRSIPSNLNAEAWHSNDPKEGSAVPDEGDRSEGGLLHDEHCKSADETGKALDTLRASCSPSCNEKEVLPTDYRDRNSFSINALIESCAKASEVGGPVATGDDVGMNLLASVATGEISKSHLPTPVCSPESSPAKDEPCLGNSGAKLRASCGDVVQNETQPATPIDVGSENVFPIASSLKDEMHEYDNCFSAKEKVVPSLSQDRTVDMQAEHYLGSGLPSQRNTDTCVNSDCKPAEESDDKSLSEPTHLTEVADAELQDKCMAPEQLLDNLPDCKPLIKSPSDERNPGLDNTEGHDEHKTTTLDRKHAMAMEEPSSLDDVQKGNTANEELCDADIYQQMSVAAGTGQDPSGGSSSNDAVASNSDNVMHTDKSVEMNVEMQAGMKSHLEPSHSEEKEKSCLATSSADRAGSITCNDAGEEMSEAKEASARHSAGSANHEESSTCPMPETQQQEKTSDLVAGSFDREDNVAISASAKLYTASKCGFDLNEGFLGDDCIQNEPATSAALVHSPAIHLHGSSPFPIQVTSVLSIPITVAPGKRLCVPLEDLLMKKSKAELGWRGSAATSAFRPAEPRKAPDIPLNACDVPSSLDTTVKRTRPALDIDLNVADERVLEDMASQSSAQTAGSECGVVNNHELPMRVAGGLDLDLNKVDECMDSGQFMASSSRKVEVPLIPLGPVLVGFQNGESSLSRDFDLNGPGSDEVGIEPSSRSQHAKNSSVPLLPSFSSHRMNNTDLGSMSSWFPPANSFPAAAIPSFLPDRGEHPYPIVPVAAGSQRVLGSVTSGGTYGGDIYRGPMLSSSSAMAFSHTAAFPYAGFPFGSNFPIVSTPISGSSTAYPDSSSGGIQCFSTIPSQLMLPSGAMSSHYPRPYLISLPEGSGSVGSDSSRRWNRPGLDLNTGPGGTDVEARVDRPATALRQPPVTVSSSQAFAEEQARIYQVAGGILKRKEPDGSWDAERYAYKQPSWQ